MAALRQYMIPEQFVAQVLAGAELFGVADFVIFVGISTASGNKVFHHYELLFRLEDVVPVNASADRFIATATQRIPHQFIGYPTVSEFEEII